MASAYQKQKYRNFLVNYNHYIKERNKYTEGSSSWVTYNTNAERMQTQINALLEKYPELDESKKVTTSSNYIEIKVEKIILRKQGKDISIKIEDKLEYTDFNISKFRNDLDSALNVIAAAAKLDHTEVKSVDI